MDAAIRRHGEETYPHECCGALVGARRHGDGMRCRCRTRPKKDRGGGSWCGRPTTGWRSSARASSAASCSGSIIRIRIIRRGRRSSISITRGRPSRTSSSRSRPGARGDMTVWFLKEDRSSFDEGELNGDENSDSDTARPYTDKKDAVEADGATIGELLADLTRQAQRASRRICTTSRASCAASSTST